MHSSLQSECIAASWPLRMRLFRVNHDRKELSGIRFKPLGESERLFHACRSFIQVANHEATVNHDAGLLAAANEAQRLVVILHVATIVVVFFIPLITSTSPLSKPTQNKRAPARCKVERSSVSAPMSARQFASKGSLLPRLISS